MKLTGKDITISNEEVLQVKEQMDNKEITKGAAIRKLFAEGHEVKDISTLLGIRYNHVYNVVANEVLIHGLEVDRARSGSSTKKQEILELLQSGMSIKEVSEYTRTLYNSVWQIAKQNGLTKKQLEAKAE